MLSVLDVIEVYAYACRSKVNTLLGLPSNTYILAADKIHDSMHVHMQA